MVYKDEITDICPSVCTPHKMDSKKRTLTCLYCGKVNKY